jgi:fatty-acyl-CoA synthase
VVSWLPLYHDMGILMVIAAVADRGDLLLAPTEDFVWRPGFWMDAVSRFRATVTVGPNQAYGLAARDLRMRPRELDLSRLRVAGNGAEPVDARVLADFAEQAGRYGMLAEALCPMYGLAEATLAVTIGTPGLRWREVWVSRELLESERVVKLADAGAPGARRLVPCGPPVPGVEVRIDGPDEVGEILVRSPSLMAGYWRDAPATAAVLRDGWLHTGDLGFLLDGELVVCGRAKDMIVVGGRNLYPEDYEQLVTLHTGVRRGNVIAFGLTDVERMVVVAETAFATDRAAQLAADVMHMLTQELSHAPKEVIMVRPGTLPKTSSGKVQRGRCRDRYLAGDLHPVATAARR